MKPRVRSSKRSGRLVVKVGTCTDCRHEVAVEFGETHGGNCKLEPLGDTTGKSTVGGRIEGTTETVRQSVNSAGPTAPGQRSSMSNDSKSSPVGP